MVCYGPRAGTIAAVGIVGYALLHNVLVRILHIAGLVLEIALITGAVAALTVLVAWTAQATSRGRAARGACTTCRFRCQRPLTRFPPTPAGRAAAGRTGPVLRPDADSAPEAKPVTAAATSPYAPAGEEAGESLLRLPAA